MADEHETLRETLENAVDQTIVDPTPEVIAPETWSDEDKQYFNGIQDPKARQWLVSRDTNYTKQLTEVNDKYKGFDDIFKPYEDRLKASNQTRQQVVTNLLNAQTILETNPVEGLKQLVQMFKISPETVMQALGIKKPADASTDPDPALEDPYADLNPALAQRLKAIDANLSALVGKDTQAQQTQIEQMRTNLVTKATEFRDTKGADGQLAYPFMADQRVVDEMSKLLKAGIVKVEGSDVIAAYKSAYERAVYSLPDLREKLMSKVDQDRVNRARQAGASVRGAGAARVTPKVGTSVREQLAAALQAQGGDIS